MVDGTTEIGGIVTTIQDRDLRIEELEKQVELLWSVLFRHPHLNIRDNEIKPRFPDAHLL